MTTEVLSGPKSNPVCPAGKAVLICTEHRGVFFGFTDDASGDTIKLKHCRMAIYWGTDKGVQQLAATGPTSSSRIGAPSDAEIRKVTAVFDVTEEAVGKWLSA